MNDQQLEDLKQFIDFRISQSESRTKEELDKLRNELRNEMHEGFAGVG